MALEVAASAALLTGLLALIPYGADGVGAQALFVSLTACLASPLALAHLDNRSPRAKSFTEGIFGPVLAAAILGAATIVASSVLLGFPIGGKILSLFAGAQFAVLAASRIGLSSLEKAVPGAHAAAERLVLVVGTGPAAAAVQRRVLASPDLGLRIVGFLDDAQEPSAPEIPRAQVHKLVEIRDVLRDEVVDEVVVALPLDQFPSVKPVVVACREAGIPLQFLADFFDDFASEPRVARLGSLATLRLGQEKATQELVLKRAFDFVAASILLVVATPIIGAAALAIAATSPGSIFFRQRRCGLNGREFEILKLRTMHANAEQRLAELAHLNEMTGPVFKIKEDPRVTPVGRWLRRLSIDELPQLWNVVRGDMSLVGPRPPIPHEVTRYSTVDQRRLSMRPGLTGAWQVSGRNRVNDFADWVQLDLDYIDNWTFWRDLRILARTIPVVLRASGE